ncbi:hypothetical protein ABPG72_006154 [Tetrahymena utriculariae]
MAGKEATIILLDMGSSMQQYLGDRGTNGQKRIEIAVNCIKLLLQQKMFNTKTHEVGLILFGLKDEGDDKIMYIRGIGKPDIDFLKNVQDLKDYQSDECEGGDIFEAIEQTIDVIHDYVKEKKYEKKIQLMTAGFGKTSYKEKQIMDLIEKARKVQSKINVIGFDFLKKYNPEESNTDILKRDDPAQNTRQNFNQKLFSVVKDELGEQIQLFPSDVAIKIYEQFRTRQVNLRSKFNGDLQLAPNLNIPVQMFTKTTEEKLPGLKQYSLAVDFNPHCESGQIERDVIMALQEDPNLNPIDKSNITKAYHYGKQLIPVTQALEAQMNYTSNRELKVLGFVETKKVPRQSFMAGIDIIIANKNNSVAKKGIAALCHSMIQTNKYAIARYVWRNNGAPKLCVLTPQIGKDYECLFMSQIPTSESVRDFQFNSLKESTKEQQDLMGSLIDKMDLMNLEDGEEALQMKYTFNPTRQYFYQTVFHRVFNPPDADSKIPPLDPNIRDYITPEKKVYPKAAEELKKIKDLFQLQEQEIKDEVSKKIFWQQLFNPNYQVPAASINAPQVQIKMENGQMESEDVEQQAQILVDVKEELENIPISKKFAFDDYNKDDVVRKISSVSPVDDFFKMMTNKREDLVSDAISQIQGMISQLIETSIRGSYYDKALECIKAFRKGCTSEYEQLEAPKFNHFLNTFKDKLLKSDQKGFWKMLIQQGITLITDKESTKSNFTTKEALQFLHQEEEVIQNIPEARKQVEAYDIMDELE